MESSDFSQFRNLDPEDYYHSEDGYIVYTEKYHLKEAIAVKTVVSTALMGLIKRKLQLRRTKNNDDFKSV